MDPEKIAQDQLESARKSGATATNIALVLFAALIVSWSGMRDQVNKYRSAMASKLWAERQNKLAEDTDRAILGEAVKGRLMYEAVFYGDKESRKRIIEIAKSAARDPDKTLRQQQREQKDSLETRLLADAIASERDLLRLERRRTAGRFYAKRALAARTPFKLLGLDFSVDGFWAWVVWMAFLVGGIFHLWLGRRAMIRRCREAWRLLSSEARVSTEQARDLADSLPLWIRPLPQKERWVTILTNGARKDLVMEPLSLLCLLLAFVCVALAFPAVRMGVISTSFLDHDGVFPFNPILHSVVLCVLCGLAVGLIVSWSGTPDRKGKAPADSGSISPEHVEVLGRRGWITSALGVVATGALYIPCIDTWILRSLLRRPRFRQEPSVHRRRIRRAKSNPPVLKEGFYADKILGRIHYVPASGRARSLSGRSKDDVQPWEGPFDKISLERAHSSAVVPFVRAGVVHLLHGYRHRETADERARILALPATRRLYREAFELTLAALSLPSGGRAPHSMPNLQLHDLLAAIAINAGSDELLGRARKLLADAGFEDSPMSRVSSGPQSATRDSNSTAHSSHSARKKKALAVHRRRDRLAAFKAQRLGEREGLHISEQVAPSGRIRVPTIGTWKPGITPDAANYTHVVRQRKRQPHRKGRHRHSKI
jgi:hypothetical protein